MRALANFIVKKRYIIFAIFAALIVYCIFGMGWVKVEYDISSYLPQDTDTKRAIDIMNEEFTSYGTATFMIKDIPYDAASALRDEIAGLDGVRAFDFSQANYKDGYAKFSITFDGDNTDARAKAAYDKTVKILNDGKYKYTVPRPLNDNYAETLSKEMTVIIAIAAAVILLVLLFTSKSFAEIIAFPIVFVVSAALNMGTNHWFGTISFVSNTVCIILQLALAIDYAIILCHRFTEEKEKAKGNATNAMIAALSKAIPEITSSSLTTVSGLVALMFMQLRLGLDLGMVLAKSIVCSLLTVFFLMPGLLLLLSKLMDKSRHRNFVPRLRFWGRGVVKARYVLIPVFVVLFAVGAVLSQKIDYVYSTDAIDTNRPTDTVVAARECEEIFGYENAFAVLLPKGDYEQEREIVELVKQEPLIDSALALSCIEYDGMYITDGVDYVKFAELAGIDKSTSLILFVRYAGEVGDEFALDYAAPLVDVFGYVASIKDSLPLDEDTKAMLAEIESLLSYAKSQLQGERYSRLVFNIAAPVESAETFALIERLTPAVKNVNKNAIFAGPSMSAYDLNSSFSSDNILITVLTIVFIYLILAFTFRSYGLPLILVLAIQGAIFMNFSLPFLLGNNMFFFTYLIISAIQMGATIDYAILLTNRYLGLKARLDRREAVAEAVSGAFPTVFTSGTIMCVAGFLVGGLTSDPLIASMGTFLGTGTLISIVCVLVFLPALLYTLDPVIKKTFIRTRHPMKKLRLDNPSDVPFYYESEK